MLPSRTEACCIFDAEVGLTPDNLWRDSGIHGLHATPIGYAGPAWGFGTGPSGAKFVSFDGATQRWTLPLAFYSYAPTTELTFVVAAQWITNGTNRRIFQAGGTAASAVTGVAMRQYGLSGGEMITTFASDGTTNASMREASSVPYTGRTYVVVHSLLGIRTANRYAWIDGSDRTVSATATLAGVFSYDTAVAPTIGATPGGGSYSNMNLYYFGIWPRLFTFQEQVEAACMLRDRI